MSEDSSVEALFRKIDQISPRATDFDLWVPERLTLHGAEIPSDVAMAVVLDRLLGGQSLDCIAAPGWSLTGSSRVMQTSATCPQQPNPATFSSIRTPQRP